MGARAVCLPPLSQKKKQAKYLDIVELLVAAGYFRARISSLSPFDRVIGGLAWCLTNSAVVVDVDVVFVENSSVGQRMYGRPPPPCTPNAVTTTTRSPRSRPSPHPHPCPH